MTTPKLPQWLWDAAANCRPCPMPWYSRTAEVRAIAIGFAASAYVAGWQDGQEAAQSERLGEIAEATEPVAVTAGTVIHNNEPADPPDAA